jgi:putative transposase
MARLPRLSVSGLVHHVSQSAAGDQPIFRDDDDYRSMIAIFMDLGRSGAFDIHAYSLGRTRFDVLLTPREPWVLSRIMQNIGRRYVRSFNDRHDRRGTLWEGRFRATLVEPGPWLLACMRWIESPPARSGGVDAALAYAWSSLPHHVGRRLDPLIRDHESFWLLGNTPFERQAAYERLIRQGLDAITVARLEADTRHGWPLGSVAFIDSLAKRLERPLTRRNPGRPRRAPAPGSHS